MVLKVEKLCLRVSGDGSPVFDGVSFDLNEGELGYVSGPQGAGKTLLGLTLCGYLHLWVGSWNLDGSIELLGKQIEQDDRFAETGVILENPFTQLSGMKRTVLHELAFPLESRGVEPGKMPPVIEQYADLFGIQHLLGRNVRTLSGGELQRVLFAASLMTVPRFIFLDRPFTEIDAGFRPELLRIIREHLRETGSTALIAEDPWLLPDCRFDREISLGQHGVEQAPPPYPEGSVRSRKKPSSGETILDVKNLSFGYEDNTPVLDSLSFSLDGGDIALVAGPNGSGKTTLAKLLAGILHPDGGEIVLTGRSITAMDDWEIMAAVGLSLQDPGLHLCRKTVGEELELARAWGNDPGPFVGLLGLDRLIDRHPLELSQAEKKRLGMALACGDRRRLIILDEPTQYQDSEGFRRMVEAVGVHADEGRAVLIITHDPRVYDAFPDAGVIRL